MRQAQMPTSQRLDLLFHHLKATRYASISELCRLLNVSESTVKRDLALLEKRVKLERTHGGVVLLGHSVYGERFAAAMELHKEQKQRIARAAAQLVEEEDIIYIDSGSTCYFMYQAMHAQGVTVFTNSMPVLLEEPHANTQLFGLEGQFDRPLMCTTGPLCIENLGRILPQKMFMSPQGLSADLYLLDERNNTTARKLMQIAGARIVMMDSSKIKAYYMFKVAPLTNVDVFITDDGAPEDMLRDIERAVGRLIVV